MTNYEVLGIRKRETKAKSTGNIYVACNLYLAYEDRTVNGLACLDLFTRAENVDTDIKVGDTVNVEYNRFGSVEHVWRANNG